MTDTFSSDNPVLQEHAITGTLATTGAVQYDVSDLRDTYFTGMSDEADKQIKLHLFNTPHMSTIQQHTRESRFSKPGDTTSKRYVRWAKNWSYTVSFKPRKDGSCSFNLYRHTPGKGLANFTSRAEVLFYALGATKVQKLFINEIRRLHETNIGPWRLPEMPTELNTNAGGSYVSAAYANEIIYNVYPGFFQTTRPFADSRQLFYSFIRDTFLPFFRQPTPAAMIEKFAGKNLDPAFYETANNGFSSLQLMLLFLFGKLIPPTELQEVLKLTNRSYIGMTHIGMMRSLLLKVGETDRVSLFKNLMESLTQSSKKRYPSNNEDYISSLNILLDDVVAGTTFAEQYKFADVKKFDDVATWPAFIGAVRAHLDNTFQAKRQDNAQKFSNVLVAFRNRFEVLTPGENKLPIDSTHFCEFIETNGGISFVYTKYGSRITVLGSEGGRPKAYRTTKKEIDYGARVQLESTMLFPRHGLLPSQHPFTQTTRKLNNYNLNSDAEGHWLLSFEDAATFVNELADTLERILVRHGLPQTKLNCSRLLGFYFGYYLQQPRHGVNGRPVKAKQVPKSLYPFLAPSELTASEILFALEQELTLEQAIDLHDVPKGWVNDLFG